MDNKIVSIIVPVYNSEKYLEECINSIMCQSYRLIDVVFVDDGSTDHSVDIIKQYMALDNRIRLICKNHEGVTKARKIGIENARGNIIGFSDADDWMDKDYIEKMYIQMNRSDADVVCGLFYIDNEPIYSVLEIGDYSKDSNITEIYRKLFGYRGKGINPGYWDKLYKKDIFSKYHNSVPEDITCSEDAICTYLMLMNVEKICITDICGYHYRSNLDSVSNSTIPHFFLQIDEVLTVLYNEIMKNKYRKILLKSFGQFAYDLVQNGLRRSFDIDIHYRDYVVPYELLELGDRVVIYGAGNVGKSFYHQISLGNYCKCVGWVDANAEKIDDSRVHGLAYLQKNEYDKIMVSVASPNMADEIINNLADMGINENKVVWTLPKPIR